MRSRRIRSESSSVSLFPFLAVLLCTMGALLVILVVIARQARAKAVAEAREKQQQALADAQSATNSSQSAEDQADEETLEKLRQDYEVARWEIENLQLALDATVEQLERERAELGNTEDHIRRLYEQMERLKETAKQLLQRRQMTDRQRSKAQADLARLRQRIEEAAQAVAKAEKDAQNVAYSIVPYEGPHGTRRRPIYIECRADGVVIQPEGIRLGEDDFPLKAGPGDPLAAALRQARDYFASQAAGPGISDAGKAYPLLIVRPEGIDFYYRARAALKSFERDFGYELVEEDWELAYPPPNPQLGRKMQQAIERARRSRAFQQRVALSRQLKQGGIARYRAAAGQGGVVQVDGPGGAVGLSGAIGEGESGGSSNSGRDAGPRGGGNLHPTRGGGPRIFAGGGSSAGDEESANGPRLGAAGASRTPREGHGRAPGFPSDGPLAGAGPAGSSPRGQIGPQASEPARAGSERGAETSKQTSDVHADDAAQSGQYSQTAGPQADPVSHPRRAFQQAGGQPSGAAGNSQGTAVSAANSGRGSAGQNAGGGSGSSVGRSSPRFDSPPAQAGRNWIVPDANTRAVAVSRPVQVVVRADRLAILPEGSASGGTVIPLGPRTEDSIRAFVAALRDHVSSWGIAGRGLYWKPVLRMHVGPNAYRRADDLRRLLQDSGVSFRDADEGKGR